MKMGRRMNRLRKVRKQGFRKRNSTKDGRKIFKRRRQKGSKTLVW